MPAGGSATVVQPQGIDSERVLAPLARHASRSTAADGALVVALWPRLARVVAAHGSCAERLGASCRLEANEPYGDEVVCRLASLRGEGRFVPAVRSSAARPALRVISVPIRTRAGPWGWLGVVLERSPQRAEGVAATLEDLSQLAAAAIDSAALAAPAERTLDGTVAALGRLLDLRDGYTSQHADQVGELCLGVGRRLGIEEDPGRDLLIAARLHDLGKIGVPDQILHKRGKLTNSEWEVMRCHPGWGAGALEGVPGLAQVAAAVRAHHEYWDGGGYPDGLAGEAIPLAARIIAACDAHHAMTADRPYRRALPPAEARARLTAGSGTQFDPTVVHTLLDLLATASPGAWPARARATTVGDAPDRRDRTEPGSRRPRPALQARVSAGNGAGAQRPGHALLAAFDRVGRLAALREPHSRAMELLAHDDVTPDVVGIIESDIALSTAVLRIAGRAAPRTPPAGIPEAAALLGRDRLRAVLQAVPTADFFQRVAGWSALPEHHRLHAVATQRAAARIARVLQRPDRDLLQSAAVLHDVGKLVLEEAYAGYPERTFVGAVTPEQRLAAERRELGLDHALVAGVLLRRWRLHPDLVLAVQDHHSDDARGAGAVVRLADLLAHYVHARPVDPDSLVNASRNAGMDPDQLRAVMFDVSQPQQEGSRAIEPSPLSTKEADVLRGLASGRTYKEIAVVLGVSVSTIRSHCHNIYGKLDVIDRANAVLRAAERGWI
jgi:putative nucleotidyltransferase with HDIG domain